jgi:hypothetical protein
MQQSYKQLFYGLDGGGVLQAKGGSLNVLRVVSA